MAEGIIRDTGGDPQGSGVVQFTVEERTSGGVSQHRPIVTGVAPSSGFRFAGWIRFIGIRPGGAVISDRIYVRSFPVNLLQGWVELETSIDITGEFTDQMGIIYSASRNGDILCDADSGLPMCYAP